MNWVESPLSVCTGLPGLFGGLVAHLHLYYHSFEPINIQDILITRSDKYIWLKTTLLYLVRLSIPGQLLAYVLNEYLILKEHIN